MASASTSKASTIITISARSAPRSTARGRAAARRLARDGRATRMRTSHNPPAPELLELTDSLGFLVMDEAFDVWVRQKTPYDFHLIFPEWHEQDLRAMIHRDRNHPSVILWSIGNEVGEQMTGAPGGRGGARARRHRSRGGPHASNHDGDELVAGRSAAPRRRRRHQLELSGRGRSRRAGQVSRLPCRVSRQDHSRKRGGRGAEHAGRVPLPDRERHQRARAPGLGRRLGHASGVVV